MLMPKVLQFGVVTLKSMNKTERKGETNNQLDGFGIQVVRLEIQPNEPMT